jgi:hypothetical protein
MEKAPESYAILTTSQSTPRSIRRAWDDYRKVGADRGQIRTIDAGKELLGKGYRMWQHPNFNVDKGFVESGGQRVWQRPYYSAHNDNRALDFPVSHNGEGKLDALKVYLEQNKARLGVTKILWRTAGHYDHLHVEFK